MKTIKTRKKATGVKVLNKTVNLSSRMKNAYIRTKDRAEETQQPRNSSPSEYASDNVQSTVLAAADNAINHLPNPVKNARRNAEKAKTYFQEVKQNLPKQRQYAAEQAQKTAQKAKFNAETLQKTADKAADAARNAKSAVKDAKQTLREVKADGRRTLREVRQKAKRRGASHNATSNTPYDTGRNAATENARSTESGTPARRDIPKIEPVRAGNAPRGETSRPAANAGPQNAPKGGGGTRPSYIARNGKAAKSTAKGFKKTAKGTVKTAKKTVKTAERTAKAAVKTAQRTANAAQKTAQATARAAKLAAKAAQMAAKAAVMAAKVTVKGVVALVKLTIAAVKGLIAVIAAGGWIAVLIILIVCLIALLVGSIFGIFFSGEDSGTGRTMPAVVSELTTEFYAKVEDIKSDHPHDVLDMGAMAIRWPEVLAVYAVQVNTNPTDAMDVATLDDARVEKLRGILNSMVTLQHSTRTEYHEPTGTDAEGTEPVVTLTITLTQQSADETAANLWFSDAQKAQLSELLNPEYADLWARLLGGYVAGGGQILTGSGSRIPNSIFSWPVVEDYPVTSEFGNRSDPFTGDTKFHGGIDISAPEGVPILAAADGIVTVANSTDSWGGGYGFYVKVQHDGEAYETLYAHAVQIAVVNGQTISKGQVIAYIGSTGRSTGNHLHFEVWKNGAKTDPLGFFD